MKKLHLKPGASQIHLYKSLIDIQLMNGASPMSPNLGKKAGKQKN
jgi:hypothetical protein